MIIIIFSLKYEIYYEDFSSFGYNKNKILDNKNLVNYFIKADKSTPSQRTL